ncbi:MAG: hypothetical protein WB421_17265, partial [Terriglobales bacterium]
LERREEPVELLANEGQRIADLFGLGCRDQGGAGSHGRDMGLHMGADIAFPRMRGEVARGLHQAGLDVIGRARLRRRAFDRTRRIPTGSLSV